MVNKQQILDANVQNDQHEALVNLVTRISKTEAEALRRALTKLTHTLYKTTLREMPLYRIAGIVEDAAKLLKDGELEEIAYFKTTPNGTQKMGNQK